MRLKLKLDFEEAVFGAKRAIEVVRREVCEDCGGNGAAPGTAPIACTACDGLGQVRSVQQSVIGSFVNVHTCPTCSGSGQVVAQPCEACRGRGRSQRTRSLEVDLPAGVEKGTQVRLSGEGEHGLWGGPPGDLYLLLDVEPHPTFRREGFDLVLELRVNPADAALGAQLAIPSLEGEETIVLPAGTQTGDAVRVAGRGVPRLRGAGRGDLVASIVVMTPEKLTGEQRELLEQLRRTLPRAEVARQERASFWSRVRERFG
jgi:molecular chaperone DnaJ